MRILSDQYILNSVIFILLYSSIGYSQNAEVTISNDAKLDMILNERTRLLKKDNYRTYFSIQVFSGSRENAQKVLKECKNSFKEIKTTLTFETPNYKVWLGKYRNQLDADRALLTIHEEYPGAFVFKPDHKKENI